MTRTPAKLTQADVARTIRAARQAGATAVEVRPDGSIWVVLRPDGLAKNAENDLDQGHQVEL